MKIKIERTQGPCETEVTVRCAVQTDEKTQQLLRGLQMLAQSAVGYRDGVAHKLAWPAIYYIDSADVRTFLYTRKEVYESPLKLYECESMLEGTSFVRISKSTIVNTDMVCAVRPLLSGKLEAALENGEKQVINRHYVADFKRKFGI